MTKNNFSILHISDLHKRNEDNYDNLLSSLVEDCKEYIDKGITKPEIIVVSGDIIRGGTNDEILEQYKQSEQFLNGLTNFFLGGDKKRIIIVPGNHDINWNISKLSMQKDILENNAQNTVNYFLENKTIRWSWDELCFYKISDKILYQERLKAFMHFYNSFYEGIYSYNIDPDEQFQIFDIKELNIAFIAFNSCFNNDHLNRSGYINPTCITRVSQDIDKLYRRGRILVSVWHHNIDGLPHENNYLDRRILNVLIEKHIQIGLFGHLHKCNIINEFKNFFEEKKMILFCAGTLYGNNESLAEGTKRQYNILKLSQNDGKLDITLYSREDKSYKSFEIPSWGEGRIGDSSSPVWNIQLQITPPPSINSQIDYIMQETEKRKDIIWGINNLIKLDMSNIRIRTIVLDYMERINAYDAIYNNFCDPINNREAISIIDSVINLNDKDKILKVINIPFIVDNHDSAVREIYSKLKLIAMEKGYGTNKTSS